MNNFLQNLRYGMRLLRKNPSVTVIAVLALGLGIGANTAIFSVTYNVLLRPLPYPDPDRLMIVWLTNPRQAIEEDITSYPNFLDWRNQTQTFERLVGYDENSATLTNAGDPEQLRGTAVTAGFFEMMGVAPEHGRTFEPAENQPGREQVVMLSGGLWRRRFGADPTLVGKSITLNGTSHEVVGILPAWFQFPKETEVWTPLAPAGPYEGLAAARGALWLSVMGRLRHDVTIEQAQAEMDMIARRLEQQYPQDNASMGIKLEPLREELVGDTKPALLILQGAVGFVLLIACANVANLLLARAVGRQREIAIRSALGARRLRLVGQLLTESILLALAGAIVGLLLALWGVWVLQTVGPSSLRGVADTTINLPVLGFTAALALLTALLFGLVPALQTSKVGLSEHLKEGSRGAGEGTQTHRLRNALVVGEIAAALVLLVGAGLMIRSFLHLQGVQPGFNPKGVLTARILLPRTKYAENAQVEAFYKQLVQGLNSVPGVSSASAGSSILLNRLPNSALLNVEGKPSARSQGQVDIPVPFDSVTPDFFRTIQAPLVNGRFFDERDTASSPRVTIVNQALARRYFSGADPVGKRVTFDDPNGDTVRWLTVVGVVGDMRRSGLESDASAELYFPHSQRPARAMTVLLRTTGEPEALTRTVRSQVWAIDKDQPLTRIATLEEMVDELSAHRRFNAVLLAVASAIALLLAAVGIYGVMAYSVTQRTHEIGVRMALGAQQSEVLRLIVSRGLGLALAGVVIGLVGSLLLTGLLSKLLYGVSARDPVTFGGIALLLVGVALVASWLPARRAARIDPVIALRYE